MSGRQAAWGQQDRGPELARMRDPEQPGLHPRLRDGTPPSRHLASTFVCGMGCHPTGTVRGT